MSKLYILQLEHGKYYVGKTDHVGKRYAEHMRGNGSEWTRLHKPMRLMETRPVVSSHDETNVTKDLMKKYGVDNVRGGAYCQVDLPDYIEEAVQHELRSAEDRCYTCGKSGHFANQCDSEPEGDNEILICGDCDKQFASDYAFNKHKCSALKQSSGACYRCGRIGHWSPDCYARTDVRGNQLDSDDEC